MSLKTDNIFGVFFMNKIVITADVYVVDNHRKALKNDQIKTVISDVTAAEGIISTSVTTASTKAASASILTAESTLTSTTISSSSSAELGPEEILLLKENILAAYNAGAAAVHLHVDNHADIKKLMKAVYQECPEILIIPELATSSNISGELDVIADEPEMAVLKCDISLMGEDIADAEGNMRRLGQAMLDNGVRPLLECCDKGMVDTAIHFYKEGWLTDPLLFLFRLGVKGGMDQSIDNLLYLKNSIPQNSSWSVLVSGDDYMDAVAAAVLMDGNVSISCEECGTAELVDRVGQAAAMIRQLGRDTANPAEARRRMSLNTKYRRVIDNHLL